METFFTILHLQLKLHRRLKLLGREFIYLLPDQAVSGGGGCYPVYLLLIYRLICIQHFVETLWIVYTGVNIEY
jgi:hypothetical protein